MWDHFILAYFSSLRLIDTNSLNLLHISQITLVKLIKVDQFSSA